MTVEVEQCGFGLKMVEMENHSLLKLVILLDVKNVQLQTALNVDLEDALIVGMGLTSLMINKLVLKTIHVLRVSTGMEMVFVNLALKDVTIVMDLRLVNAGTAWMDIHGLKLNIVNTYVFDNDPFYITKTLFLMFY